MLESLINQAEIASQADFDCLLQLNMLDNTEEDKDIS
jgi:hypothetical protein